MIFCFIALFSKHIKETEKHIEEIEKNNLENKNQIYKNLDKIEIELYKIRESISIIDVSIHSDNKKWAKVKQIRKIIVETLKIQENNNLTIKDITDIATSVIESSEENGISISLILSIITVESAFSIKSISKAGARGLMQIMPETAVEISTDLGKRNFNLFRIRDNIQFGSFYLWKMINLLGDVDLGIRAYNCGSVCVERVRSGEYKNYPIETINYLEKVNIWKKKYSDLGVD